MRLLICLILLMASCSHTKQSTGLQGPILKDAYYQGVTGGKEHPEGLHTSLNYFFLFDNAEGVNFTNVCINNQSYGFEQFDYQGVHYVVAKTYPLNPTYNQLDVPCPKGLDAPYILSFETDGVIISEAIDSAYAKPSVQGN